MRKGGAKLIGEPPSCKRKPTLHNGYTVTGAGREYIKLIDVKETAFYEDTSSWGTTTRGVEVKKLSHIDENEIEQLSNGIIEYDMWDMGNFTRRSNAEFIAHMLNVMR